MSNFSRNLLWNFGNLRKGFSCKLSYHKNKTNHYGTYYTPHFAYLLPKIYLGYADKEIFRRVREREKVKNPWSS